MTVAAALRGSPSATGRQSDAVLPLPASATRNPSHTPLEPSRGAALKDTSRPVFCFQIRSPFPRRRGRGRTIPFSRLDGIPPPVAIGIAIGIAIEFDCDTDSDTDSEGDYAAFRKNGIVLGAGRRSANQSVQDFRQSPGLGATVIGGDAGRIG